MKTRKTQFKRHWLVTCKHLTSVLTARVTFEIRGWHRYLSDEKKLFSEFARLDFPVAFIPRRPH